MKDLELEEKGAAHSQECGEMAELFNGALQEQGTVRAQEQGRILREGGMSTVEIILILVVLIALVIIFKSQITALVVNIFASINKSASTIY